MKTYTVRYNINGKRGRFSMVGTINEVVKVCTNRFGQNWRIV